MKRYKKLLTPLIDLPTPISIRFVWNFGFLLGILLLVQIVTGVVLSMRYIQSSGEAFLSIIYIIRDCNNGWLIRLFHSNVASFFFMRIRVHLLRGVFFTSFKGKVNAWVRGSTILLVSIATAFFGYVLPWGQMSYWGATVITNIISALPYIGTILVEWLWGNFSVSQPTLNRFFSIHFFLPIFILVLIFVHIIFLHLTGSSNPIGIKESVDKVEFNIKFLIKDFIFLVFILLFILGVVINLPDLFIDPENINEANPMKAPIHIQPEWYFLFAYSILRSIPSKLGGVVFLIFSIGMYYIFPLKLVKENRRKFSPKRKVCFIIFIVSIVLLTYIGSKPVEDPYLLVSKVARVFYFLFVLF